MPRGSGWEAMRTYYRRTTVTTPTPYIAHVSLANASADAFSIAIRSLAKDGYMSYPNKRRALLE